MKDRPVVEYPVWLSTTEAARYLGVVDVTARKLAHAGEIPCYRVGRSIQFRLDDLQAYLAGTRVVPGSSEQ